MPDNDFTGGRASLSHDKIIELQTRGLLAAPGEVWVHRSRRFQLEPRRPGSKRRARTSQRLEVAIAPGFDPEVSRHNLREWRREDRQRQRRRERQEGIEEAVLRGTGRTLFLGARGYRDDEVA